MDGIDIARRIDHGAALRLLGGDVEKPLAQALVQFLVQAFESIGSAGTGGDAGEAGLYRQVEDQRQVGSERTRVVILAFAGMTRERGTPKGQLPQRLEVR